MTDAAAPASAKKPTALSHLLHHRRPLKNVNAEVKDQLSPLNRVALVITTYVGTMGFFIIIFVWTASWLAWNMYAPAKLRFDPATGFVLYLFMCNVIQILLMPLIMVGQNLQAAHSEARAENDLEINIKAEKEIEVILEHLEYQNRMIIAMVEKLGCELEAGHHREAAAAEAAAKT